MHYCAFVLFRHTITAIVAFIFIVTQYITVTLSIYSKLHFHDDVAEILFERSHVSIHEHNCGINLNRCSSIFSVGLMCVPLWGCVMMYACLAVQSFTLIFDIYCFADRCRGLRNDAYWNKERKNEGFMNLADVFFFLEMPLMVVLVTWSFGMYKTN